MKQLRLNKTLKFDIFQGLPIILVLLIRTLLLFTNSQSLQKCK